MKTTTNLFRVATVCLLPTLNLLSFLRPANAQTTTATAPITFAVADGITLYKFTNPVLPVKVSFYDPSGIITVGLNSKVGSGGGNMPAGTSKGSATVYFFAGFYPAGDYTFTASLTNRKGATVTKTLTVHLKP